MRKTPAKIARDLYVALSASPKGKHAEIIRGFLEELVRTRRTSQLRRVVDAFTGLALAAQGKERGTIVTAHELDEKTRRRIAKRFPQAVFEEQIDPSIVGGAIVTVGDTRIDASVRGKARLLRSKLAGS